MKLPVAEKVGCGGCGGGGCGTSAPVELGPPRSRRVIPTSVPFEERRLNLAATPTDGTFVATIDFDLTVECNLRCVYCFKEKWNEHMEDQVAFDTLVWLLYASGPRKDVYVNFMGGEPLLRFQLIKKIVPFGKRRAWQMGKSMHFGMTTNGTLVTDAVVDFWKRWGLGFHTSIDGTAEVQDRNRPTTGGRGSSSLVEKAVPKILGYRPNTTARSTVVPSSAGTLTDSYAYFRKLGYTNIAFVPGGPSHWDDTANRVLDQQFQALGEILIGEFRAGNRVHLKGIEEAITGHVQKVRPKHACGAGRGLLLVDIRGNIWPCHRWNKESERSWQIGNIYEQFDDMVRAELDRPCQTDLLEQDCARCVANTFCGGGCPAENLEETGRVYRRHPNACEHTRIWARVGIEVHDVLKSEGNPLFMQTFYPDRA